MVHNNKILTVSYGTFSCTLEGFDDSFDTMKAIAEYFRDLAADDRYFGAEPPQPDADMLARIAQREITRQVEAHSTDTGTIVLRATEPAAEIPAEIPAEAPVAEPAPQKAPDKAPDVATPAEATPEVAAEPDPEPEPDTAEIAEPAQLAEEAVEKIDPVADPAPVQDPTITPEVIADADTDTNTVDDQPETAEAAAMDATADTAQQVADPEQDTAALDDTTATDAVDAQDIPQDAAQEIAEPAATATPAGPTDALIKDVADRVATPEADSATPVAEDISDAPAPMPAADSIAAKLQRIRAVVSQNDSLADMDDYTEDQHADGYVAAAAQDISDALDADDEISQTADPEDDDDQLSQILDQFDANAKASDDEATKPTVEPGDGDAISDPASDDQPTASTDTDDTNLFDDGGTDDGPAEESQAPLNARVVKVKRAELDAAIASGQLEQIEDDSGEDKDFFTDPDLAQDGTLSPEDEADLMRELAAVEDEMSDDADDTDNIFGDDSPADADTVADEAIAHAALQKKVGEDEADLSRLMSEADQKLDDPETSSRHETYSQLRGAVAVAQAEASAGGSIDATSGDEAYRDDLAEVVRPRRPSVDGARGSRPVIETRPAPLKLVAEQRVDDGAGVAQRGPVRPRRVITTEVGEGGSPDATGTDSAFAEFAARMGATELPDLLEAAAAYLSFVEGHDRFSRPQLMNKVRLIKQDDYNREDGLRSFGQLLRDGKIEKRGGGRFAASGEIGFQPDAREAS